MPFEPSVWNDTDPDYAPCRGKAKNLYYWKAPKKYLQLGYEVRSVRLTGQDGDGLDRLRASECRAHTRKMLNHFGEFAPNLDGTGKEPGTWGWIIARWKADPHARYKKIKGNTRAGYDPMLDRWDKAIGKNLIGSLNYEAAGRIVSAMQAKGRSQDDMARMFGILRTVARYAQAVRVPGARDVVDTLAMFRFEGRMVRSVSATRDQVRQIITLADQHGMFAFGTGILIQWTYAMRAVDVRGQWLPAIPAEGGIQHNGLRWQDGLTWDMFDADLTSFRKVISKTSKSMPEAMSFDLTDEVRDRLIKLGPGVGPVIVSERLGRPYEKTAWTKAWGRLRKEAGIPEEVKMMDVRAGAITEAKSLGLDPFAIRDAAGHRHLSTTDGYARERSINANKVVKLRSGK